jgi:hypothetical protein
LIGLNPSEAGSVESGSAGLSDESASDSGRCAEDGPTANAGERGENPAACSKCSKLVLEGLAMLLDGDAVQARERLITAIEALDGRAQK